MTATVFGSVTAGFVLSGGDLTVTNNAGTNQHAISSVSNNTGKFYAEITIIGPSSGTIAVGLTDHLLSVGQQLGYDDAAASWAFERLQLKFHNGSYSAYGTSYPSFAAGDVVSVLWDADAGTLEYWVNGTTQGVAYASGVTGDLYLAVDSSSNTVGFTANFGASAWAYTPTAGYSGWTLAPPTPGDGEGTLPAFTAYGARLAAGAGTLRPITGAGGYNGIGAGALRAIVASGTGGHSGGAGALAALIASATGRQENRGAGTLLAITAAGTGYDSSINVFDKSVPVPTLSATVLSGEVITVSVRVPAPVLVATMLNPAIITFAGTVRPPVLVAQSLTGNDATFYGTVAAPIFAAAGYPTNLLSVVITVPSVRLSAVMSAPVASAFRTWVLNTRKGALTEYGPEWAMNSYAVFNGSVLGCTSSGVVELGTQDLDNATAIASTVTSGKDNFGGSHIKRVPRAYIDYTTDGDATFSLTTTEGGTRKYALNWNNVTGSQQRRIPVGKGPKSSRWQWSYSNVNGADFDLNAVMAYPTATRRRVQ